MLFVRVVLDGGAVLDVLRARGVAQCAQRLLQVCRARAARGAWCALHLVHAAWAATTHTLAHEGVPRLHGAHALMCACLAPLLQVCTTRAPHGPCEVLCAQVAQSACVHVLSACIHTYVCAQSACVRVLSACVYTCVSSARAHIRACAQCARLECTCGLGLGLGLGLLDAP